MTNPKKNALNPFGTGEEATRPSRQPGNAEAHTAQLMLQTLHSMLETKASQETLEPLLADLRELYPPCAAYLTLPLSHAQLQQCANALNFPLNL